MLGEFFLKNDEGHRCKVIKYKNIFPHMKYKILLVREKSPKIFLIYDKTIKGSVQRKLRWVENCVNRCVWAWDCGTGHFYVLLLDLNLVFTIFLFLVSTAQFIGEFWKNRLSATSDVTFHLLRRYMN